ncbi:MAG: DNA adenine methylase [Pseudomonadota bacterium]|jgi:DNA adenine methylase
MRTAAIPQIESPLLRYHGGKWRLADDIVALMPKHRRYVEPFGGGASVLLRKPRAPAGELYNDLDGEIANLFAVMRHRAQAAELARLVALTPYARDEFQLAYDPVEDPVERARRTLVRAYMGFGTDSACGAPTGFRVDLLGDSAPARVWSEVPDRVAAVASRFAGVVVENRNALEVIADNDASDVLFYVDPPYVPSTRSHQSNKKKGYRCEMREQDHEALLELLVGIKGLTIISGYRSDLYDRRLGGWRRIDFPATAHGGLKRTECVWLSPNCEESQGSLF